MPINYNLLMPAEIHVKECVDVYLADLKLRIKQLQQKQNQLDQGETVLDCESEADATSEDMHDIAFNSESEQISRIKSLIQKFEELSKSNTAASLSASSGIALTATPQERINVYKLLHNFEELHKTRKTDKTNETASKTETMLPAMTRESTINRYIEKFSIMATKPSNLTVDANAK